MGGSVGGSVGGWVEGWVGGLTLDNLLVKRNVVENVGFIKINNPPVNAMSVNKGVPQSILDSLQIYENDSTIKFIVIVGEEKLNFSGGADISEFGKPTDSRKANLRDLIDYLDKINKPCFAIITGPTMGGGLELALGCHFRLADQSAKLALPEVKLGILPGAGGTQSAVLRCGQPGRPPAGHGRGTAGRSNKHHQHGMAAQIRLQ